MTEGHPLRDRGRFAQQFARQTAYLGEVGMTGVAGAGTQRTRQAEVQRVAVNELASQRVQRLDMGSRARPKPLRELVSCRGCVRQEQRRALARQFLAHPLCGLDGFVGLARAGRCFDDDYALVL